MKTVNEWEYTSRFGHVGKTQTNRAKSVRILEYFSDSYAENKEAFHKARVFLSIHDYVGRHAGLFCRKGLVEQSDKGVFMVEPNLLRAVHYAFTTFAEPETIAPKKVLMLAKALQEFES